MKTRSGRAGTATLMLESQVLRLTHGICAGQSLDSVGPLNTGTDHAYCYAPRVALFLLGTANPDGVSGRRWAAVDYGTGRL